MTSLKYGEKVERGDAKLLRVQFTVIRSKEPQRTQEAK